MGMGHRQSRLSLLSGGSARLITERTLSGRVTSNSVCSATASLVFNFLVITGGHSNNNIVIQHFTTLTT